MKRAKIFLTAIALMAIIGGAFAFKTTRVPHSFFSTGVGTTSCIVPFNTMFTTNPVDADDIITFVVPYTNIPGRCGILVYKAI